MPSSYTISTPEFDSLMNFRTAFAWVPVKSFVEYRIATRLIPSLGPSWVMKSASGFGQMLETGSDINTMWGLSVVKKFAPVPVWSISSILWSRAIGTATDVSTDPESETKMSTLSWVRSEEHRSELQ